MSGPIGDIGVEGLDVISRGDPRRSWHGAPACSILTANPISAARILQRWTDAAGGAPIAEKAPW